MNRFFRAVNDLEGFRLSEKSVLSALAQHADPKGQCFPGIERIARIAGCTPRGAQRIIRRLQSRGLLLVITGGGRHQANRYTLLLGSTTSAGDDPGANPDPAETPTECHGNAACDLAETPTAGTRNPDRGAKKPRPAVTRTPIEQEREQRERARERANSPSRPPRTSLDPDWSLTPERLAAALEAGLTETQARSEAAKFPPHHRSRGTRSCDWEAEWLRWVLGACEFLAAHPEPQPRPAARRVWARLPEDREPQPVAGESRAASATTPDPASAEAAGSAGERATRSEAGALKARGPARLEGATAAPPPADVLAREAAPQDPEAKARFARDVMAEFIAKRAAVERQERQARAARLGKPLPALEVA